MNSSFLTYEQRFALESESKAPEPVDGPAKESDASRRLM